MLCYRLWRDIIFAISKYLDMKSWNVRSLIAAIALVLLVLSTGCSKKDKDDPNNGGGQYPFYNTEYTGTAKVGNHYFPRPLSLRFGDDNTVSAFSHLVLNKYHREFTGKITHVEKDGQGSTRSPSCLTCPAKNNSISRRCIRSMQTCHRLPVVPTRSSRSPTAR